MIDELIKIVGYIWMLIISIYLNVRLYNTVIILKTIEHSEFFYHIAFLITLFIIFSMPAIILLMLAHNKDDEFLGEKILKTCAWHLFSSVIIFTTGIIYLFYF